MMRPDAGAIVAIASTLEKVTKVFIALKFIYQLQIPLRAIFPRTNRRSYLGCIEVCKIESSGVGVEPGDEVDEFGAISDRDTSYRELAGLPTSGLRRVT